MVIFSHRYFDSECINFKTFVFLVVLIQLNKIIQHIHQSLTIFDRASTMLNTVISTFYHKTLLLLAARPEKTAQTVKCGYGGLLCRTGKYKITTYNINNQRYIYPISNLYNVTISQIHKFNSLMCNIDNRRQSCPLH